VELEKNEQKLLRKNLPLPILMNYPGLFMENRGNPQNIRLSDRLFGSDPNLASPNYKSGSSLFESTCLSLYLFVGHNGGPRYPGVIT